MYHFIDVVGAKVIDSILLELGLPLLFVSYGPFQWKRVVGYFLISGALSSIFRSS